MTTPNLGTRLATLLTLEAISVAGSIGQQPETIIDQLWRSLIEDRLVRVIDTGFGRDGYMSIGLSTDVTLPAPGIRNPGPDGVWGATRQVIPLTTQPPLGTQDPPLVRQSYARSAAVLQQDERVVQLAGLHILATDAVMWPKRFQR